jgi:hypothetical protein
MSQKTKHVDAAPVRVAVPVPPMLEEAIGYTGPARFVAFSWTPYGDEAEYTDGRYAGTGHWDGFLAYIQHPTIAPKLRPFDFGSSEAEATHTLLLDRDQRILYIAPAEKTDGLLRTQWPEPTPVRMTKAALEKATREARAKSHHAAQTITPDAIMERLRQHHAVLREMQTWLDQHPSPVQ